MRSSASPAATAPGRAGEPALGLAIVQAVAEAHAGRGTIVTGERGEGDGTTVRLWLPDL